MRVRDLPAYTIREVRRLSTMIIFSVAVVFAIQDGWIARDSALAVVLYKPALCALGVIAGHIAWSQLFYYIDMGLLYAQAQFSPERARMLASVVMGRCVFYAAFVLGVSRAF